MLTTHTHTHTHIPTTTTTPHSWLSTFMTSGDVDALVHKKDPLGLTAHSNRRQHHASCGSTHRRPRKSGTGSVGGVGHTGGVGGMGGMVGIGGGFTLS